jgi:2-aminoethylphosphonate-pyruvate transaminase
VAVTSAARSLAVFPGGSLGEYNLPPELSVEPLHDAMKARGYIIYAGQGDIRKYAFRVSNMGTLTPRDMQSVVSAFGDVLAELGVSA